MPDLRETLAEHLGKAGVAPFLFVGAGLSRRYLQLEGWEGLLHRMAELTEKDYDYYRASAGGVLPQVATEIAKELHEPWWSEPRFAGGRERFGERLAGRESALKAETSLYLADSLAHLPKEGELASELDLLRDAVVDGIVTTNFDPLLEHIRPDFKVFVGQEKLLFGEALGVGEIYKIHGSHEDPDSLVLTAADYERFEKRNAYLAAKLMTIFVEHPIVFLGYSLGDRNVASILESIVGCLDSKESLEKLTDRLIFIEWEDDAVDPQLSSSAIRVGDITVPMKIATVSDFSAVYEALGDLHRGFPAKLLRQLKEQVYELVLENDAKSRLHVAELGEDDDLSEVEVVFGVGAIEALRSYVGLDRDNLVADVMNGGELKAARVVTEALPKILTSSGNTPMYKYLRAAGMLDSDGELLDAEVPKKVVNRAKARAKKLGVLPNYRAQAQKAVDEAKTLNGLVEAYEPHIVLQYIPALPEEEIEPEALRRFLLKHQDMYETSGQSSQWVKIVCFYDWLRFGRQNKSRARRGPRPRLKAKPHTA